MTHYRNIEFKQKNLDDKRKEQLIFNNELKAKNKSLTDKEYYLNEKSEKNEAMYMELKSMSSALEKDKKELALGINSLEARLRKYDENNRILEQERENLIKTHNELETEKIIVNTEKIKIEQQYADVRLRTQNLDVMLLLF